MAAERLRGSESAVKLRRSQSRTTLRRKIRLYLLTQKKLLMRVQFPILMKQMKNLMCPKNRKQRKLLPKTARAIPNRQQKNSDLLIMGDEDDGIPSGVKSAAEKIGSLLEIWNSAKYPIKKIFKGIHLSDVYIDLISANEDAYDCALKYGRICAVTYNGLAVLGRIFDLRIKTVDINPGFSLNKSRWDVSVSVSFRLGTLVISGIWFLMTYIFRILLPKKLKERKLKKTAAVQE